MSSRLSRLSFRRQITAGTTAPAGLAVPALLVLIAGCSALTRVPPEVAHPAPVATPTATAATRGVAPAKSGPGSQVCGVETQIKSTAASPLAGRLPVLAGMTFTDSAATGSSRVYRGFVKGRPAAVRNIVAGASAVLSAGGFSVTPGRVTGSRATNAWSGKGYAGTVSAFPLCRDKIGLDYLVRK